MTTPQVILGPNEARNRVSPTPEDRAIIGNQLAKLSVKLLIGEDANFKRLTALRDATGDYLEPRPAFMFFNRLLEVSQTR